MTICNMENEATEEALAFAKPGDTLIIAAAGYSACWKIITSYKP